jgi:hypothetical protein
MDPFADIDLDSEAVWLDGAWYSRQALAQRLKDMIESGDFRVSRPSQALERLEAALGQAQVVAVRMPTDLAEAAASTAARLGRPVGQLVREAIAYYLAAAASYGASPASRPPQPAPDQDVDVETDAASESFFDKVR